MDRIPLVNGTAHAWVDITVNILGVPLAGITALNYKDGREKQNNYGAGSYPVSRGRGKNTPSASITLHSETVKALQDVAPSGRLDEIPAFDIPVLYLPENSANIKKDIIRNVEFTEIEVDTKSGDMEIPIELPLIISHVSWNQSV